VVSFALMAMGAPLFAAHSMRRTGFSQIF